MKKRAAILQSVVATACLLLSQQAIANDSAAKIASVDVPGAAEANFSSLVDDYFASTFKRNPNWGSRLGLHQYDTMTPDLSAAAIAAEAAEVKEFEKKFGQQKPADLGKQSQIDLKLINADIKGRLLELDQIRGWEKDPDEYSGTANTIVFEMMKRDFAPLADRLKLVILREKKIKSILQAGKANVKNPPKLYTQIAIEQMPAMISFFQNIVPEYFKPVTDNKLQEEFQSVNQGVIQDLKDFQTYLKDDLLPRSNGSFVLGPDFYAKRLLYGQMVDTPIDQLLADGYAELHRVQKEFTETTHDIDPSKSAADVMTEISKEHTTPDKLLSATTAVLQQLKDFCIKNNLVTIPEEHNLHVAETPPFKRALSFASMDSPGPFEAKATEAYYFVTLPESDWKRERTEEHMRAYCNYDLLNTSDHEAYPGHYVQGLWVHNAPSKTTKILSCGSNSEGWAHYCEQMMVEQGLDDHSKKLKLIMLHDALLRCCRYIVGISLHTKGMTYDDGIAFFMKEGYQERANAERETKRGAMSPTYLIYTLGKLQILALREDYKKLKGDAFTLKDFHDRFLSTGRPPVKIIREIMLADSTNSK